MGVNKQLVKPILTHGAFVSSYHIKSKQLKQSSEWFPLYPSPELAAIAAALMTDGHIDWNTCDNNPRPKKIILYSNYKTECKWFLDAVRLLFGVKGKIVSYVPTTGFSTNESYKAILYNAPLARILIAVGVPSGDKTQKAYQVPNWIMNGSKEIKSVFLSVLFNFDGSISFRKRRTTAEINFCFNKHHQYLKEGQLFMQQIKCLLEEFEIPSGKIHIRKAKYANHPKHNKDIFMLFISNHRGIVNFYRHIGFLNRLKQRKLQRFIYRTYKTARVPFVLMPPLLVKLKEKLGTDREVVHSINLHSKVQYTHRQFEHIRRGELKIPLQMAIAAMKILGTKRSFTKIPEHYRYIINIYDNFFLQ